MLRVSLLGYLVVILCGLVSWFPGVHVDAACATSRVRKNYDSLTLTERQVYRRALQLAMDRGLYIKFVEMHMEKMSEMEAHRVCMFTYWHRYFLIGFENMLRSLGPEFQCVTIPYWDEMQGNARALAGSCPNLEACSLIIRDLGGSSSGVVRGLSINGAWVTGDRCVKAAPLGNFCESSSRNGTACARCLPRSNLQNRRFPSATNFASVYRQLFTSGEFVATGKSIEEGMHNAIHAELGATMGTFQSPADPLFWSHHAYVDLLLTIYLNCRVGLGRLTDAQKMNNQFAFVSCPHREDAGFFTSTSTVTMRSGERGVNPTQVSQAGQVLLPFFQSIPNRYYQLSDITQLGTNRYAYRVGGLVGHMASRCDAATGTVRRLEENDPISKKTRPVGCVSDLGHEEQQQQDEEVPVLPGDSVGLSYDTTENGDVDAGKVLDWVDEVRDQLNGGPMNQIRQVQHHKLPEKKVVEQLEKMVCMFYDSCRGGVQDYSEQFKIAFKVTEPPPCKRIVDELKSNTSSREPIRLPKWKETMEKYFPCTESTPSPPAYQ